MLCSKVLNPKFPNEVNFPNIHVFLSVFLRRVEDFEEFPLDSLISCSATFLFPLVTRVEGFSTGLSSSAAELVSIFLEVDDLTERVFVPSSAGLLFSSFSEFSFTFLDVVFAFCSGMSLFCKGFISSDWVGNS